MAKFTASLQQPRVYDQSEASSIIAGLRLSIYRRASDSRNKRSQFKLFLAPVARACSGMPPSS
jgi:hypothetical protein